MTISARERSAIHARGQTSVREGRTGGERISCVGPCPPLPPRASPSPRPTSGRASCSRSRGGDRPAWAGSTSRSSGTRPTSCPARSGSPAHDLDITPGVFPDDYSRGHPPLLYLLAGLAFRAFGATPTVGHLLVLPFTVVALAGTYLLGAGLFDRRAGAAAALLLGVTPLFMSMGNMLLPEMPLTALAVLSFLALARGRVGVAAAAGVAAVWMKETGIFAAAGVGAAVLLDAWWRGSLQGKGSASPPFRRCRSSRSSPSSSGRRSSRATSCSTTTRAN
ncbi:MAG: glycosyltransferase family 39 protein [Sandaracinaceae bacterium]